MGRQKGAFPLQATLGDVTFYKSQDGYMIKNKSGVSKDRIHSDPKFQRTRENMAEFGNACKAGKTLRTPFKPLLKQASDNRMISRLSKQLMAVLKTDTTDKRGKRTVGKGDLSLLNGFEFNDKGILSTTLTEPYSISYARATGDVSFTLDSFIAAQGIQAPQGATHYQFQLAAAPIDFNARKNLAQQVASSVLPWNNVATTALNLSLTLTAASTLPVFILLQLQFLEQVNADYYPLQTGSFNACAIIDLDIP